MIPLCRLLIEIFPEADSTEGIPVYNVCIYCEMRLTEDNVDCHLSEIRENLADTLIIFYIT